MGQSFFVGKSVCFFVGNNGIQIVFCYEYMKVRASVKKICVKCKTVRRGDRVRVVCANPRHKQRQG